MRKTMLFCLFLCIGASQAHGGGFLIYEHGAAGTGMASARSAVANDLSALYFCPAAITELDGLQLELGTTGVLPYVHYEAAGRAAAPRTYPSYDAQGNQIDKIVNDGENSTDAKIRGFTPIHLYVSYRIRGTGLTVGYGLNNPFGLGTYYPGDWDGRFIGTETEIQTFFNQPTVALDVAEVLGFKESFKLAVAAGFNLVYGTARLAKRIDLRVAEGFYPDVQDPWGEMRMLGSALGYGWNVALFAEFPGWLALGASLRSGVNMPFSGTAKFSFTASGQLARERLGLTIPDETNGRVSIDLPLSMNVGLAFIKIEHLTIALDFFLALFQSYDQLALSFDCLKETPACETLDLAPIPKNWKESWQVSLGAEYWLSDRWAARAGVGTVSSPVPAKTYDPSLPDGQRLLLSVGGGFRGETFGLDLGYMLAMCSGEKKPTDDENTNNQVGAMDASGNPNGMANGKYSTLVHLLALSFSARF